MKLDTDAIRKRAGVALTERRITLGCSYDIEDLLDRNELLEAVREAALAYIPNGGLESDGAYCRLDDALAACGES